MTHYTEKSIQFFQDLDKHKLQLVDDFYAQEASFMDPLGKIQGRKSLKAYYEMMYEHVTEIQFNFTNTNSWEEHVYLHWTMIFKSKKLKKGKTIELDGLSYIKFNQDGKAIHHQDSFDIGSMLYEHIPVLGYFVKKIKKRLEHTSP